MTTFQNQNQNQNQNECETEPKTLNTNPYPPPTALYSDLVRDANLFREKLQSFHDSFGTKLKLVSFSISISVFLLFFFINFGFLISGLGQFLCFLCFFTFLVADRQNLIIMMVKFENCINIVFKV